MGSAGSTRVPSFAAVDEGLLSPEHCGLEFSLWAGRRLQRFVGRRLNRLQAKGLLTCVAFPKRKAFTRFHDPGYSILPHRCGSSRLSARRSESAAPCGITVCRAWRRLHSDVGPVRCHVAREIVQQRFGGEHPRLPASVTRYLLGGPHSTLPQRHP